MPGFELPGSPPPVTVAIIGCGQRGREAYAPYALTNPQACKVVAIAEPRPKTRSFMTSEHKIDSTLVFHDWKGFYDASAETLKTVGKRLADAVLITVQDEMHAELVEAFAAQGYHILCEKPMATKVEDCVRIENAVKKAGVIFGVGHVLRYSPYTNAVTEIVRSGTLGKLINVVHIEPVGHWHFAHSYVRGNWSQEAKSSFSLMTKSCHDIDILNYWLSPAHPTKISSFGGLQHFRREEKPAEAGDAQRCLDCKYEKQCPYSAKKVYLDSFSTGVHQGWPASAIVDGIPDIENITEALQTGPYGKCVYESPNDVCDHQTVNIQYSSGATVSFTMVAFTSLICERQTRMHFTHGEIVGNMNTFEVTNYRTGKKEEHRPENEGGGHGGGDSGLMRAFVRAVKEGRQDILGTDVEDVLKSHLTVFAAEESRKKGVVLDVEEFEREARTKYGRV